MPYEPIHHKYRPQTFKDLVGQETITLTLTNALKQEKIAPAYLFTGPRGTGKTSSARILAKSLNCLNSEQPTPEPCGKCEACRAIAKGTALDVMEIDAASNTGVDNIREIIERSRFAPVQCRYKIYVVDECHMLSSAAFNALLKTLEEPPPRVVFILATTDPQRVLSTIISRCQRFDYRRIALKEMVGHLKYIAKAENIAIADEAVTLIAQIANGGLRDAESLLDQLSLLADEISVAKVWDLVGAVPEQDLLKLLQAINNHHSVELLQQCRSLLDRGREPIVVLQNLANFYLNLLIAKTAPEHPEMVAVTETCWQQLCIEASNWDTNTILRGQQHLKTAETQLKQTTQPRLWLEVTLLGLLPQAEPVMATQPQSSPVPAPAKIVQEAPEPQITVEKSSLTNPVHHLQAIPSTTSQSAVPVSPKPETKTIAPISTVPVVPAITKNQFDIKQIWHQVVSCLQPPTTQALLKQQCTLISFDGSSAIVGISSATLQKLHQGKVPNIEKAFAQVLQQTVKVQLEVASAKPDGENLTIISPPVPGIAKIAKPNPDNFPLNSAVVTPPTEMSQQAQTPPRRFPVESPVSPPAAPSNSIDKPPELSEDLSETEFDDDELQKAIASLTQSFEGEVVQIDGEFSNSHEISLSSSKPVEQAMEEERPDLEDYDDEW